jgi:hypothetical protein
MVQQCTCDGCIALRKEYGRDPDLLAFYAKKLLIRGWAKSMSDAERLYLSNHSEWYQSAQEKGRKLAAAYPQNIKGAAPQPVTQMAFSTLADPEDLPSHKIACH